MSRSTTFFFSIQLQGIFIFLLFFSGGAQAQSKLTVYPLGDSITRGIDDIGYRQFLFQMAQKKHVDLHFVGTQKNGPTGFRESQHEGHNGWTIADLSSEIENWLNQFHPDVILLMIGSNDIEQGQDFALMPARMNHLLEQIQKFSPHSRLLVSEISLIDDDVFDHQAQIFNHKLSTLIEQRKKRGQQVVLVPMHDVLTEKNLIQLDHPDPEGNRLMAARWLQYLLSPTGAPKTSLR